MRLIKLLPVAVALAILVVAPASAKHGPRIKVIATGLDNPRHVAVSKHGDVYVAESGRGGDHATSRSCFDSAEGFACTGDTGAVTRVRRHHGHSHQRRVATGLASFAPVDGANAIGPHGVFVSGHRVYVTNGGPTAPTRDGAVVLRDPTLVAEEPVSALYGTLLEIGKRPRLIADLWRFEHDVNPDAEVGNPLIDSNPVDVAVDGRRLVVADAGGNTVLRASQHGAVSVVSLFPNVLTPNPFGGPDVPMNAVPTGVVTGRDGAYYVSQLTGFPFPVGGASVFRVNPRTGAYTRYATGFTNVMDLDFGPDGTLYVLELDSDSLLGPGREGGLWAVPRRGGAPRRIALPAGTLIEPGGLALSRHGTLFVSTHAREAGAGEVVEIRLRR